MITVEVRRVKDVLVVWVPPCGRRPPSVEEGGHVGRHGPGARGEGRGGLAHTSRAFRPYNSRPDPSDPDLSSPVSLHPVQEVPVTRFSAWRTPGLAKIRPPLYFSLRSSGVVRVTSNGTSRHHQTSGVRGRISPSTTNDAPLTSGPQWTSSPLSPKHTLRDQKFTTVDCIYDL